MLALGPRGLQTRGQEQPREKTQERGRRRLTHRVFSFPTTGDVCPHLWAPSRGNRFSGRAGGGAGGTQDSASCIVVSLPTGNATVVHPRGRLSVGHLPRFNWTLRSLAPGGARPWEHNA